MPKGASTCECKATRCHFPVFELTLLMFGNIFGLQLFRAEEGKSLALELCEVLGAVKGGPWTTWV